MERKLTPKQELLAKVEKFCNNLPAPTPKQQKFIYRNIPAVGTIYLGNRCTCTQCGHKWADKNPTTEATMTCPECGTTLKMEYVRRYNKRRFLNLTDYSFIITTFRGSQVIRLFQAERSYFYSRKKDEGINERRYFEAGQIWLDEHGNTIVAHRQHAGFFSYYQERMFSGWGRIYIPKSQRRDDIMFRMCKSSQNIYPDIRVLPVLKRNGFKGNFHDIDPEIFFANLLKYNILETMLKTGDIENFKRIANSGRLASMPEWERKEVEKSLRICVRHKYRITDFSGWLDTFRMLREAKMDTHNPVNICPEHPYAKHEEVYNIVHAEEIRQRREEEARLRQLAEERAKQTAEERNGEYIERVGKFFKVDIHDDEGLQISVLPDINAFYEEGKAMHHCVYSCRYYDQKDSLILSARVNGERAETIELSLNTWEVLQSRAVCNGTSQYHDRILALMKKSIPQLQRLA
jgi:hypothetical protein